MHDDVLPKYFETIQKRLLAEAAIAGNFRHNVNKGSAREIFARRFLEQHLGEGYGFGTGEIIHSKSEINEVRNQHDIVIYRKSIPKLEIAAGIHAFLAESVFGTIEVKSVLRKKELKDAVKSAIRTKSIEPSFISSELTTYTARHFYLSNSL